MNVLVLILGLVAVGLIVWLLRAPRRKVPEPVAEPASDEPPVVLRQFHSFTPPVPPRSLIEEPTQEIGADFYDEVVGLLRVELARSSHRHDLRFKLLEVYAATDRRDAFVALAEEHRKSLENPREGYWPQIVELGRRVAADHPLFARTAEESAAAEPDGAAPRNFRRWHDALDPQKLSAAQVEIHNAYQGLRMDADFWRDLREHCLALSGEPTPLVFARRLSLFVGGARIYVRNESRRATRDSSVVSAVGQALLAKSMGRKTLLAATQGDGHALAIARIARRLGLQAQILSTDSEQSARAEELEAAAESDARIEIVPDGYAPSTEGQRIAMMRALEDPTSLYISPLAAGPFPYPVIVRELQGLHGRELRAQVQAQAGRSPDGVIVSASDGMPAIGFLQAFLGLTDTQLFCVEAGIGKGSRHHRLAREHAWLRATGRVRYCSVPEEVATFAAHYCLPDHTDSLHLTGGEVLVETFTLARQFKAEQVVVVVVPADPDAKTGS